MTLFPIGHYFQSVMVNQKELRKSPPAYVVIVEVLQTERSITGMDNLLSSQHFTHDIFVNLLLKSSDRSVYKITTLTMLQTRSMGPLLPDARVWR